MHKTHNLTSTSQMTSNIQLNLVSLTTLKLSAIYELIQNTQQTYVTTN